MVTETSSHRPMVALVLVLVVTCAVVIAGIWRLKHEVFQADQQGWPVHEPEEGVR